MMKKGFFALSALLTVMALVLLTPLQTFAAADDFLPGDTDPYCYFKPQLNDDARLLYEALCTESAVTLLQQGKPVTVGEPYSITIPERPTQAEYDALVSGFNAEAERLGRILGQLSNAAAALDRDRPAIFWTGGVYAYTVISQNGTPTQGQVSLAPGNTYAISLEVGFHLLSDWDGEGQNDRVLATDIATVEAAVEALADQARAASDTRYGQLQYVNEQLCKYNDYNSAAASANGSAGYGHSYPWTPLAALDQLQTENDANSSLKPVCEGYARAFKMVSDRLGIHCVLVSGVGNGEDHMWNYVYMEDGVWYAVDVTWNDSTRTNDYFLVGQDVMARDHSPNDRFMGEGQSASFVYPTLSQDSYDPNKLSLEGGVDGGILTGGGSVFFQVGGALEGSFTLTCDDNSIAIQPTAGENTWKVVLPNADKTYTFTLTYTGDGVYNGLTATSVVTVRQHTHAFGNWTMHDGTQHKSTCSCGEEKFEAHTWGEKTVTKQPTESATGTWEQTCICGKKQSGTIPQLTPTETDGNGTTEHTTQDSTESDTSSKTDQKPDGEETKKPDASNQTQHPSNSSVGLFGCTVSVLGAPISLLVTICAAALIKRKKR